VGPLASQIRHGLTGVAYLSLFLRFMFRFFESIFTGFAGRCLSSVFVEFLGVPFVVVP